MDLAFDLDREEGDQLVAQYSLIPTPLSRVGPAHCWPGKTENCMSHPALRGTGFYSSDTSRSAFEREKQRYSVFFTTAGQVSRRRRRQGASSSSAMRRSDDWANVRPSGCAPASCVRSSRAVVAEQGPAGQGAGALARRPAGRSPCRLQPRAPLPACAFRTAVHAAGQEPLDDIAALWRRNRERYGISVDRTADYLRWRVDDDPHLSHEYFVPSTTAPLWPATSCTTSSAIPCTSWTCSLTAPQRALPSPHGRPGRAGPAAWRGPHQVPGAAAFAAAAAPARSAGFFDTAVMSPSARPEALPSPAPVLPLPPGRAARRRPGRGPRRAGTSPSSLWKGCRGPHRRP